MATKKRMKRFDDGGIADQTEEEAANEAEMMSSMARKRAMDEGDRDEKAMPTGYKAEAAPVMRKKAMPKPAVYSNEGRSSKAPAPSTPARKIETVNVPKAIGDFFRPKSAAEKDSANRAALRDSEKAKPKAQMTFQERYASQGYAAGGSASSRADGIATKGKTRGKMC